MSLRVGELYALMRLNAQNFFSDLDRARAQMQSVSQRIGAAGASLTAKATLPIVGLGAAAVATVAKFDDSMSKVSALSGATGEDLEKLRGLAKELGSATAHSASAAADAMGYLALAGWDVNQIMSATPAMLSLASAGAMDLATAADIVSDTMSMFQMNAEDAGKAADIFAAAQSKSNTNVQQLGEAMKYAGAAASAAGMDLEQTSAVMGVLANNGLKGSSAGTTFVSMLSDMKKASEDGNITIGKTAVALYDQVGNMRDLGAVMADVEQATEGMTGAQRDAALGAVYGIESQKGVNIMLGAGSEAYKKLEETMYGSAGAAAKAAETMEDNIGGAMRALGSATEGLAISFGEVLAPMISSIADKLAAAALYYSGLSEETKKTILVVGAIVAAIGPLLLVVSALIGAVTTVMGILPILGTAFMFLTGPIGLTIAAVTALAAAIFFNWDEIKAKTVEIWEGIKTYFTETWTKITNACREAWERFKADIFGAWDGIKTGTSEAWIKIKNSIFEAVLKIGEVVTEIVKIGENIVRGLFDGIINMRSWLIDKIKNFVQDSIVSPVKKFLRMSSPSLLMREIGENTGKGLGLGIEATKDIVKSSAITLVDAVKGVLEPLKDTAKTIGSETGSGFANEFTTTIQQMLADSNLDADIRRAIEGTQSMTGSGGGGGGGSNSGNDDPQDVSDWPTLDDVYNDPNTSDVVKDVIKGIQLKNKMLGFASGGIVPGPLGSAQLAVVHGGEEVLTPQQRRGGGDMNINGPIYVNASNLEEMQRDISRRTGRRV